MRCGSTLLCQKELWSQRLFKRIDFKMTDDCDWKRVQKAVFPCLLASLPVSVDISVIECTQQIANICKHHTLVSSAGTTRSWSIRDWQ